MISDKGGRGRERKTLVAGQHCYMESFSRLKSFSKKISEESRRFLDRLEDLWTVWRISRQSGRFLDKWKVSRPNGQCQKGWKISGDLVKFLNSLGSMHLNYMNPQFNATQAAFTGRCTHTGTDMRFQVPTISLVLHWTVGLTIGGICFFKTGTNKFYTSKVMDRKKSPECNIHCLRHFQCHPLR